MTELDSVSSDTAKLLKDVTGESHLDSAVRMTVSDALKYRLKLVQEQIEDFEEEYGMEFEEFEEKWQEGEIQDRYSFDVESDYWKWEGLVTREKKIQNAMEELEG